MKNSNEVPANETTNVVEKELTFLEKLQAAAAAKYAKAQTVVETNNVEQQIKDATRKAVAEITLSNCIVCVNNAVSDAAEKGQNVDNVDTDKTAQKLFADAKKAIATISKGLQEIATSGNDVDLSPLESFEIESVKIDFITFELPPMYKGALCAINFAEITVDAKQKLALIGIVETEPFCVLTSLTYDKNANNVFAKVGSFDLSKGTVRLSLRFIAPIDDIQFNSNETLLSFNTKVDELKKNIVASGLKISAKSFIYVAEKLNLLSSDVELLKSLFIKTEDETDADFFNRAQNALLKCAALCYTISEKAK